VLVEIEGGFVEVRPGCFFVFALHTGRSSVRLLF
jgi:hypothetical protein